MIDIIEAEYIQTLCHISKIVSDDSLYEETIDGVPIRKLFVDNLADRTTFKDLRNCFSVYGNIENCYLRRNQGKKNYAFVTFTRVEDAMAAMQDGSRKQIRLHNRDLRVMAADSWHQPDSVDQKLYNIGKESNKTFEKKTTNEQYHQCLQNDVEDVSIHILNDDCLRHIFLFLPIIDRVRIERVCKRWRDLSQDSWRMMKTLDLSPSTWGFLETHTIRTATLRKVLLKCGSLDVTDIGLAAIATLPKLEQLIINYVKKITDNGLENMCGLKNLECRKCTSISDQGMSMFIRSSPYLQLLDISGCHNISNITLDAAKDACNTRSNNVMLKMIIGNTSIFSTKEQDEEQTSPLLQIVNVDLCDDDFNMLDIDEEDMSDEDIYDVDDDSWIDEDSDYDYSYENEDLEPDNIYF
ncbi:uncharacterized protein LOC115240356 isoform X5 [Formica exsecta]|uniref:uncharacterized protein LOC115240356 isoform X5 n=1 Tax=Formica exsecta TaxID=72781 RepID=UPI0011418A12|nr:uncharacterized protein LOC115240356 isoform X5 [Formica exsecta]